jgi:hypothetical protein
MEDMLMKFKVFLLIGCFILIATTALAEPFWYFHTGHTIKYTRAKADGTNWVVTMTIGAGGQNKCGSNQYYEVNEYNYDNKGETDTKYLRVADEGTYQAGYQCQDIGGTPTEIMFFRTGPEGTGWQYPPDLTTDGVKFQIVSQTKWGAEYTIRRHEIEGGIDKPNVFNHFTKGFGLWKETDNWVSDNAPWTQVRHGYRGKTLYVTFTGYGLYAYDYDGTSTWTRIDRVIPDKIVAAGPLLYLIYASYGLYVWDGTVMTRLDRTVPQDMVAAGSTLYVTYTSYGLYSYDGKTWTRIDSRVPTKMVTSGPNLYAIFTGRGLYQYNGTTWTRLDGNIPVNIVSGQN